MVFGPLGDRIGRQRVLAATMIMMAVGTLAIGLIPSYASIGIMAPVLLLVARLVQGFSTGGEYGGAATFIAEFSTDKRRGFMGSFLEFGTLIGYVMGAGVVALLTASLSQEALLSWGWRVPFLIAGPLGLIGLYIRMRLEETPAFKRQAEEREAQDKRRAEGALPRNADAQLARPAASVGLVLIFNVTDYMVLSYLPSFMSSTLHFDESHSLVLVLIVMVLMMPLTLAAGRLSVGRKPVMLAGCVGLLALSIPSMMLIHAGTTASVFGGLLILGVLLSCFTGVMPSALPALFPTEIRYGALAIGFNVSGVAVRRHDAARDRLAGRRHAQPDDARVLHDGRRRDRHRVGRRARRNRAPAAGGSPPAVASRREAHQLVRQMRGTTKRISTASGRRHAPERHLKSPAEAGPDRTRSARPACAGRAHPFDAGALVPALRSGGRKSAHARDMAALRTARRDDQPDLTEIEIALDHQLRQRGKRQHEDGWYRLDSIRAFICGSIRQGVIRWSGF